MDPGGQLPSCPCFAPGGAGAVQQAGEGVQGVRPTAAQRQRELDEAYSNVRLHIAVAGGHTDMFDHLKQQQHISPIEWQCCQLNFGRRATDCMKSIEGAAFTVRDVLPNRQQDALRRGADQLLQQAEFRQLNDMLKKLRDSPEVSAATRLRLKEAAKEEGSAPWRRPLTRLSRLAGGLAYLLQEQGSQDAARVAAAAQRLRFGDDTWGFPDVLLRLATALWRLWVLYITPHLTSDIAMAHGGATLQLLLFEVQPLLDILEFLKDLGRAAGLPAHRDAIPLRNQLSRMIWAAAKLDPIAFVHAAGDPSLLDALVASVQGALRTVREVPSSSSSSSSEEEEAAAVAALLERHPVFLRLYAILHDVMLGLHVDKEDLIKDNVLARIDLSLPEKVKDLKTEEGAPRWPSSAACRRWRVTAITSCIPRCAGVGLQVFARVLHQ